MQVTLSALLKTETEWLESSKDAEASEFVRRKKEFDNAVTAIVGEVPIKPVVSPGVYVFTSVCVT